MQFTTSVVLLSLLALSACKPEAKAEPAAEAKPEAEADADADSSHFIPSVGVFPLQAGYPLIPHGDGYGVDYPVHTPAIHPVPCYDDAKVIYSTIVEQVRNNLWINIRR